MSGHIATNEDFENLDIRVGRAIDVQPFPEGRYSTHILMIDFGPELGTNPGYGDDGENEKQFEAELWDRTTSPTEKLTAPQLTRR